jgi:hypothetical protein
MCCGSRRSAWRSASASARAAPQSVAGGAPGAVQDRAAAIAPDPARRSFREVMLRYMQPAPIRVWGPVTGRPYDFSAARPVQAVEARDAAALTRTHAFRRAEG